MSLESPVEENKIEPFFPFSPVPSSEGGRFAYFILIVVLPFVSFWFIKILKPDWQSGNFSDYVILFLFPKPSTLFISLLIYSIISYTFLLADQLRYSNFFVVRLGIYTGTLLALQYSVAIFIVSTDVPVFLFGVWLFPVIISLIYRWLRKSWEIQIANIIIAVFIVCVFLSIALLMEDFSGLIFLVVIAPFAGAPFWSLVIMLRATIWLLKNYETKASIYHGIGVTTWLAIYVAAWRFDILKVYELYNALPKVPVGDCYIATAAAYGHPRFVRSRKVCYANGTVMRVNPQLQILKCFELALLVVNPLLHKAFRNIYDVVGKSLAQKIQHPLLADLAYVSLKPFEWLTRLMLRVIIPEIDAVAERIYKP